MSAPSPSPAALLLAGALAALALGSGCRAPAPRTLDDAYVLALETGRAHGGFHALSETEREALAEARRKVIELEAQGAVRDAGEAFAAAFVLCSSRDLAELELAHELALAAGDGGDPRGWPLAAEALDRALVLRGLPQRFGTQIGFEPVLGRYRVLPVDPRTTDADRAAFGVPSLAELERIAAGMEPPER